MYALPSSLEGEPLFANLPEGYDHEWLQSEFQRMIMAGFLPTEIDYKHIDGYRDKALEWLDIFREADTFVQENKGLITGEEVLSGIPLYQANSHTQIADIFLYLEKPPKYIYEKASWYSNGDHPVVHPLRKAVLNALFIDPGQVVIFKNPKDTIFVETADVEKKYPNSGYLNLYNGSEYAGPTVPGKQSVLLFNPNMKIGHMMSEADSDRMSGTYYVELEHSHSKIVMMLDLYESILFASLITSKVTHLKDGTIDVRTIRFHPNPVLVHYSSRTNEIRYAVPMHFSLGSFSVIPGSHSPNRLEIPLNPTELESFIF